MAKTSNLNNITKLNTMPNLNTITNLKNPKTITNHIKTYFSDWTLFEKSWLFIFTVVNIYLFFAWHDTLIGLAASLTGMIIDSISGFSWSHSADRLSTFIISRSRGMGSDETSTA